MNKFREQQLKKQSAGFPNIPLPSSPTDDMRNKITDDYRDMVKPKEDLTRSEEYGYDPETGTFDGDIQNIREATNYLKENPNALAEGVPRQEGARMHYASEFRHLDSKVGKMVRAYLKENPKDYSGARKIRNEHRERLQYLNHMAGSPFSD